MHTRVKSRAEERRTSSTFTNSVGIAEAQVEYHPLHTTLVTSHNRLHCLLLLRLLPVGDLLDRTGHFQGQSLHLSSNGDLDLDTGLDVDDDLLDDLGRRLWILISKVSQVLEPSPLGVLRVVTRRFLVGRRTGPLTRRSFVFARSISSLLTFSSDWTLREVRVMRILWILGASPWAFLSWKDMIVGSFVGDVVFSHDSDRGSGKVMTEGGVD